MTTRTVAFRIFGHGVVAGVQGVTNVAQSGNTATLTVTPAGVNWSTRAWSTVLVRGCSGVLPDGRYVVTGGSTTTIEVDVAGVTVTPGSTSGVAALDDCYTFCERLPSGLGSDTATRWATVVTDVTNSIGSTIDIAGGVSESDGLTLVMTYSVHPAVVGLCRAAPVPVISSAGVALSSVVTLDRSLYTPLDMGTMAPVTGIDATLTVGDQLWIDSECLRIAVDGVTAGAYNVDRGILGTTVAGHGIGAPLSIGIPAPEGRGCEIVIYDDDTDPTSVLFRLVGEVTRCGMENGATLIRLEVSTDAIRPLIQRPMADALVEAQYSRSPDGEHLVTVVQSDPESYWSWFEFGPIAVRARRRNDLAPSSEEPDTVTRLGYTRCTYELPPGLVEGSVVISDPAISRQDAGKLLGNQLYSSDTWRGFPREGSTTIASTSGALDVQRDDAWWTNADGTWRTDGRGLFELHTPVPVHVVEAPGAHAFAILDPQFLNVEQGISVEGDGLGLVDAVEAATQVLISTGGSANGSSGQNGASDLLPAELSCGIDPSRVIARLITASSALGRVVLRIGDGSLADTLTEQILKPSGITLTQTSEGLNALASATILSGARLQATIADADILSDPGSEPDIEGPIGAEDFLFTSYTVTVSTIKNADTVDFEARTTTNVYGGSAGFTAGNGAYGRVVGRTETVTAWGGAATPGLAATFIQQNFGVLRREMTLTIAENVNIQPGAFVGVSLTNVPGADGTRGFVGRALVVSRVTELRDATVRVRLLLIPDSAYGQLQWAPGLPVASVTSATAFTLDVTESIHLEADDMIGPAFAVGDQVDIYTRNMTLRSTSAPGTVATYNDATGAMTLSVAASDGLAVLPIAGDIVTLALYTLQPNNSRAKDDFAYFNRGRWTT